MNSTKSIRKVNGTQYNKVKKKDNLLNNLLSSRIDNSKVNYGEANVIKGFKVKQSKDKK